MLLRRYGRQLYGGNNINALCFQQFNKLILIVRLLQDCFHAMFGHLGEFLVLLKLLGRISEPLSIASAPTDLSILEALKDFPPCCPVRPWQNRQNHDTHDRQLRL